MFFRFLLYHRFCFLFVWQRYENNLEMANVGAYCIRPLHTIVANGNSGNDDFEKTKKNRIFANVFKKSNSSYV